MTRQHLNPQHKAVHHVTRRTRPVKRILMQYGFCVLLVVAAVGPAGGALDLEEPVACKQSTPCPPGQHDAVRAHGLHAWTVSAHSDFAFRILGFAALCLAHEQVCPTLALSLARAF